MDIIVGCDHGGYYLKAYLIDRIKENYPNFKINDVGTYNGKDSCDYPDFCSKVCESVVEANNK